MLRKAIYILFSFYYLALATGVSISAHYCLGQISSFSVFLSADACACGAEEAMPCCSSETVFLSLDEDQVFTQQKLVNAEQWIVIPSIQFHAFEGIKVVDSVLSDNFNTGPPDLIGQEIRLMIHSLTYYG